MKKFILAALITFTAAPAFCWYKIIRENRGLFGYYTVAESTAGPNTTLACSNPGRKDCVGRGSVAVNPGGPVIDDGTYSGINNEVDDKIKNSEYGTDVSGSFYYGSDFYVKFTYDFRNDKIEITIYSIQEAKDLGLI